MSGRLVAALEDIPRQIAEVLFQCPVCRDADLKAVAYIELQYEQPTAHCADCGLCDDDPDQILEILAEVAA